MTAALIETDSFSHASIAQGVPTFKGRSMIAFGNRTTVKGTVFHGGAASCIGFVDDAAINQRSASLDISYQYPAFEASGSAGSPEGFFNTTFGVNSVLGDKVKVVDFGCGDLETQAVALPSTNIIAAMILSGRHLQSKVGTITGKPAGLYSLTGLGFTPQLVLFTWYGWDQYNQPSSFIGEEGRFSFGAFDGLHQWSYGAKSAGWITGGARRSRFTQSGVSCCPDHVNIQAISLDADGFTLNYGDARGYVFYHAFADPSGDFKVGTAVEGDTSIPTGFEAEALLLGSSGCTAFDTTQDGAGSCFGGTVKDLTQHAGFATGRRGGQLGNYYYDDCALALALSTAPTTLAAKATCTALGPTAATLTWPVGGGGGIKFGYVAMRLSNAAGFEGCGGNQPWVYRYRST